MVDTKVRATVKQYGTVKLAAHGESAPGLAVSSDDPRLSDNGGTGGTMLPPISYDPPLSTLGAKNDWVISLAGLKLYFKSTPTVWIYIGTLALAVTNANVSFKTPTAGTGRAILNT